MRVIWPGQRETRGLETQGYTRLEKDCVGEQAFWAESVAASLADQAGF